MANLNNDADILISKILRSKRLSGLDLENIDDEIFQFSENIKKTEMLMNETVTDSVITFSKDVDNVNALLSIVNKSTQIYSELPENFRNIKESMNNLGEAVLKFSKIKNRNEEQMMIVEHLFMLPKLMKKCINHELFHEACSILNFCSDMSKRIHPDNPFNNIVHSVHQTKYFFIHELLIKLSDDLTLSKYIKIFSILKQLIDMTDLEFKYLFLLCRGNSLEAFVQEIKQRAVRIDDITNLFHKHVHVAITFYLALFNDGKSMSMLDYRQNHSILASWVDCCTRKFTEIIEKYLYNLSHTVKTESFSELIGTFSKIDICLSSTLTLDCELNGSLDHIYQKSLKIFYTKLLDKALQDFETSLDYFIWDGSKIETVLTKSNPDPELLKIYLPLKILHNFFITINNTCIDYMSIPIMYWLSFKLQAILESCSRSISNIKDTTTCNNFVRAFIYVSLPLIFQMVWKSLHSLIIHNFLPDLKKLSYLKFIEDLRTNYKETNIDVKLDYHQNFVHFNARSILMNFSPKYDKESLKKQEYFLMFKHQFFD